LDASDRAFIESIAEAIHGRIDDLKADLRTDMAAMQADAAKMHGQNLGNFDRVFEALTQHTTSIAVLEEAMATLKAEYQRIRDRWHRFRDTVQDTVAGVASQLRALRDEMTTSLRAARPHDHAPTTGADRHLTRQELIWIILLITGCLGLGFSAALWLVGLNGHPPTP
jgi:hypothetical protein